MSSRGALVVFGSGPGIGTRVAQLFASHGFSRVILLSRDSSRLSKDAESVRSAASGATVETVTIDLSNTSSISTALAEVDKKLGEEKLEVVLFNAAHVDVSRFFDFKVEDFETDLRITVTGMYVVAQWAFPQLLKVAGDDNYKPSFLVTSGLLAKDPYPQLFSLSTCKGAQYSLVHSLHKLYSAQGVHCALVLIGGVVSDDAKVTNAKNVAEEFWKLYGQKKPNWDLDVEMLEPGYNEMMKKVQEDFYKK